MLNMGTFIETTGGTKEQQPSLVEIILGVYYPPVHCAVGWVGNAFILLVLSRRNYRRNPNCLCLRFLACWSHLSIFVDFEVYLLMRHPEVVANLGDVLCKQFAFVAYGGVNLASWTIVLMTFTRFVAVVFPLQSAAICTTTAVKRAQVVIVAVFVLWGLPAGIYQRRPTASEQERLGCYFDVPPIFAWVYETVHVFLLVIIPFFLLFIMNLLIILTLRARSVKRNTMGGTVTKEQAAGDKVALTLVAVVTVIFMVTTAPYAIHVLYWDFILFSTPLTSSQQAQYGLSHTIALFTFQIHDNAYFFTFFIACKRFRDDLLKIFRRCCRQATAKPER